MDSILSQCCVTLWYSGSVPKIKSGGHLAQKVSWAGPRPAQLDGFRGEPSLLELDGRALLLEFLLDLLGLGLVEVLLDGLGGAVDEVLGFLEAQAGVGADDLDDLDLLVA